MKYKLINKTTGEEHICSKVVADGFYYYYVSDEHIDNHYKIKKSNNQLSSPNSIRDAGYDKYLTVITTNNPNIDLPQVIDAMFLAEKHGNIFSISGGHRNYAKQGFLNGYNKSQETHSFSDADMVAFAINSLRFHTINKIQKNGEELLELWKDQQIKTLYYI